MERGAWDYVAGGADDERALRDNLAAFSRLRLRPRVLRDVSTRDLGTSAFGRELAHPIVVAPMAAHALADPEAECATARGAASAEALNTLSTISSRSLEEVATVAPDAPRWFQLYTSGDRSLTQRLVERAVAAGYGAIVVTVDLPLAGNRERDLRNGFVLPLGAHLPEEQPVDEHGVPILTTMDWDALAWLREVCPVPLVVKGILRVDDALRATELGCDGVWVSNHGGRQLEDAIPGIEALPEIAAAIGGRALLVVDGGVRRGTDVLKALALGANLVAVGRPIFWGLAAGGADGVQHVLEIARAELSHAMALAGCRTLEEIGADLIA